MSETLLYKQYSPNENKILKNVNYDEIRRYAGMRTNVSPSDKDDVEMLNNLMEECVKEALPKLTYKVTYRKSKLEWKNGYPILPVTNTKSEALKANLNGCLEVCLFAATIGIEIDRLIMKYSHISKSKALFFQALGAERVEALCDAFENDLKEDLWEEGKVLHPRFSPGYGDFDISAQKGFIQYLDCNRRLGITLNDSLLMSPSKSVTALIGVEEVLIEATCSEKEDYCDSEETKINRCKNCTKKDCEYSWQKY
ncbi:MAG: Vitamin B12 dependent methionine synthase activation subunit [Lachnospiraceae bacterium]|nr:Vitamin B12 dependent methionine synthase activation subunit [Lachnospiraceae bacterium]